MIFFSKFTVELMYYVPTIVWAQFRDVTDLIKLFSSFVYVWHV